ncbi:MAG: hypothetical protein AAGA96_18595 [Verrucomicrobiota bacterium]
MKETDDVQRLIKLKRYETPGEDYFSNFADEFKDRQRSEMLRQSSRTLLLERVGMWFEETGPSKWAVPAGAAAAAGALLLLNPKPVGENVPAETALSVPSTFGGDLSDPMIESESADSFEISLPKKEEKIPPLSPDSSDFGYGLLPVGAQGNLREL